MAAEQARTVIGELRRLIGRKSGCTLSDAQLLDAFVRGRDEASFEVLVWRHGTMVLSLCQRVLHDTHEAEDAFQAAFLVFARKAGTIGQRESVGSWLYKVAYRLALRVRGKTKKNCRSFQDFSSCPADVLAAPEAEDAVVWRDLRPVLDEEIGRLPEKYRAPFVLCHLQGQTNEEAAAQLGCPKGTILSRLARGRARLRSRLTRRGVALSAGWLALVSCQKAAAAIPAALVNSTVKAAIPFAAGKAAAGLVSTTVAALTEGVLNTMFLSKLKIAVAALLALAVVGSGTGWLAHRALADRAARPAVVREAVKPPDVSGTVIAVLKDGKGITVEIPALRSRTGEGDRDAKKVDIKFGDKTAAIYNGVGPDGAKPTIGYGAQVQLEKGTTDVAAAVSFQGLSNGRGRGSSADIGGKILAVANDGKSITVETSPARRRRGEGDEEAKKMEISFNDKTVLSFSSVPVGGAKLVEGLDAQIQLADGPKGSIAAIVYLRGKAQGPPRGVPAKYFGNVIAVADDGKAITLETTPARGRGRGGEEPQEAKKLEIKLGDKTAVIFNNVSADGTKIAKGLQASVWLEEGSKDGAATVIFTGVVKERWTYVNGPVLAVAKDGKTITMERPARGGRGERGRGERGGERGRREAPEKVDIKITDKTLVTYYGIGPDGAKPTEGYQAHVRLADEPKDTAAQVMFYKGGGRGRR